MKLRALVGSGHRIGLFLLPFLVIGLTLNVAFPEMFRVGGPPSWLRVLSLVMLVPGVAIWLWSAILILQNVPRSRLITWGPYAWVKHPLYTAVALLVLPWLGFLLATWLGAALGAVLYVGSRLFAPAEEVEMAQAFGPAWSSYSRSVKLSWI
jgi:protein-S-isoprenylcysteine O-methyltransferase Ste14